ncbi:MAG: hypothetical protein FWC01_08885 [Treponema sp.]|nr:hypothetical protein [Treponema sp.]MCL2238089.1 hypothetical protein [Treponema sp.]
MVSLEHVQLLEQKVAKAIEHIQRLSAERTSLYEEIASLKARLDGNQKRLEDAEMVVMRFKEDQSRIEDGIMAALNRLSQFEEAFESSITEEKPQAKKPAPKKEKSEEQKSSNSREFFEITQDSVEDTSGELDIF